jgi:RimJ/RimL family protein N-acetyltransferase
MIALTPYSTERLLGYRPQLACFDLYRSMFQDEAFAASFGIKLSDEKIKSTLSKDMTLWDEQGFGPFVWFEKSSGEFVGRGGLNQNHPDGQTEIELTYSLLPKFWGQGYATEIGQFALHQAFQELCLSNIVCFTSEENSRSLNVMKKLGFKYEKDFMYAGILHRLFRIRRSHKQESS